MKLLNIYFLQIAICFYCFISIHAYLYSQNQKNHKSLLEYLHQRHDPLHNQPYRDRESRFSLLKETTILKQSLTADSDANTICDANSITTTSNIQQVSTAKSNVNSTAGIEFLYSLLLQFKEWDNVIKLPILSILTGVSAGYFVTLGRTMINNFHTISLPYQLLVPLIGSLISSLLLLWYGDDILIGPYSLYNNLFNLKRQLLRWVGVLAVVASGTPMAISSPAGEVGMTVGRIFTNVLPSQSNSSQLMGDHEILVLSGASAGFCANFDAPLAAILYACEVSSKLTGKSTISYFDKRIGFFLLASLASSVIKRKLSFSSITMLSKHTYPIISFHLASILQFAFLGVTSGILAHYFDVWFRRSNAICRRFMNRLIPKAFWLHPMFSGLVTVLSLLLIGESQSLVEGFNYIDKKLSLLDSSMLSKINFIETLRYFVMKYFAVGVTVSSNILGGIFTPSLFIGSALGSLVSLLPFCKQISSIVTSGSRIPMNSVMMISGSAGFIASIFQAPLTSIILMLEMSKTWDNFAPITITTLLSHGTTSFLANRYEKHLNTLTQSNTR